MPQQEPVDRLDRTTEVPAPSAAAVVSAFAYNLPEIGLEGLHRIVTRRATDADLVMLGATREEAVELARAVRRTIGPAYRRLLSSARRPQPAAGVVPARVGTRARGAGRPAARRARSASTGGSSGDDGSGPGEPEPPSDGRPARRWAIYPQQLAGGRHRAVIVGPDASSTWRAGS